MDLIAHFERETTAFHRAALMAAMPDAPPPVPSCPDWTAEDLVRHLGRVHHLVNHIDQGLGLGSTHSRNQPVREAVETTRCCLILEFEAKQGSYHPR